ncbi:hypothetical protein CRI93_09255 [Longimonas halophila]|uniref:DUF92 domain-containing protein n=1 Tax=Longimonas halophila TaxID=1469170 RepID=A0A2H3NKT1_9BACT|nr:DUF92 domain-containing protein [Longimonas halophila]PEN06459.1 hypothetical protein CRI93_09255 [Longimonas halophila]
MLYTKLAIGGALAVSIAVVVYKMRWLTKAGAGLGGALGAHVVLVGGTACALPLAAFVVSGSLLARLEGPSNETTPPRTAVQVLANGGVAWGALAALPYTDDMVAYLAFTGALATATADTWGTEIGTRWHGQAWSLATGRWVKAGASGAISVTGTAAGVVGASVIAALAAGVGPLSWSMAGCVAASGVVGSLVDSMLGAFVQAQYTTPGDTTLHDTPAAASDTPARGFRLLTNSGVNALATLAGSALAISSTEWLF